MKDISKKARLLTMILSATVTTFAGNNQRAGQAGANELLVNPWSRSTGMGGAGTVLAKGLEAMDLNVAGLAELNKFEVNFSHRDWLSLSGIDVNTMGLASHVGESGALGIEIKAVSFGKIEKTSVNLPEGGLGSYNPVFFTIGVAYAKQFSQRINGGITVRAIHEEITNVKADGIALDAGVNYTTGIDDEIKFGIALRNVGPAMTYRGSGLTTTSTIPGSGSPITVEQRSQQFELPSLINIGIAYDYLISKIEDSTNRGIRAVHRISPAFNFVSNSFVPDQFAFGVEYAFKEMFMGRLGYLINGKAGVEDLGSTSLTGLSAGLTVEYPMSRKKNNGTVGLDFSWQQTDNFGGITSLGLRLNL